MLVEVMMDEININAESTLTERFQTTVPSPVRKALGLQKKDKIAYTLQADGTVVISKLEVQKEHDPVLSSFLVFLESDLQSHPENLVRLTTSSKTKIENLIGDIDLDLDEDLSEVND